MPGTVLPWRRQWICCRPRQGLWSGFHRAACPPCPAGWSSCPEHSVHSGAKPTAQLRFGTRQDGFSLAPRPTVSVSGDNNPVPALLSGGQAQKLLRAGEEQMGNNTYPKVMSQGEGPGCPCQEGARARALQAPEPALELIALASTLLSHGWNGPSLCCNRCIQPDSTKRTSTFAAPLGPWGNHRRLLQLRWFSSWKSHHHPAYYSHRQMILHRPAVPQPSFMVCSWSHPQDGRQQRLLTQK